MSANRIATYVPSTRLEATGDVQFETRLPTPAEVAEISRALTILSQFGPRPSADLLVALTCLAAFEARRPSPLHGFAPSRESAQIAIHPGFGMVGEICPVLVLEVRIDDD